MGDKTGIEWTDASWNPLIGCRRVSPGCQASSAERKVSLPILDGRQHVEFPCRP